MSLFGQVLPIQHVVSPKSILLFVCEVLPSPLVARSQGHGCLQAVKEIYEIVPARKWRAEEKQINKIVFIGHHLNGDILEDSFRSCTLATI
ncbi:hypothetical protein WN943_023278 [Citrus x changshan-huyou]